MSDHEESSSGPIETEIEFRVATPPPDKSQGKRRQFVLVSRRIVPAKKPEMTKPRKFPIKITHRICQICQNVKAIHEISMIHSGEKKMFVLLSALFRQQLLANATARLFKMPTLHICTAHLVEATSEILNMFGVCSAVRIGAARTRKVERIRRFATLVTGKEILNEELLTGAAKFIQFHADNGAVVGPMIREEDIPVEETVECQAVISEAPIVPKCFRQPRKQRFEQEDQKTSSILRIIKQEPFELPENHQSQAITSNHQLSDPLKCCYCLELRERNQMIRIPTAENRIAIWANYLGDEFQRRLRNDAFNFMCRRHFSKDSFSSRGRLLKGAYPNVIPPAKVQTFKIDGDDFVEVNENHLDEDDSEVDIEN